MLGLLSAAWLASLPVTGNAHCPSPAEVQTALGDVLPSQVRAGDVATVDDVAAGLRVALRDAKGAVIGERLFTERTGCDTLAQAAALLIAAWETETPPGTAPEPSSGTAEPEGVSGVAPAAPRATAGADSGVATPVAEAGGSWRWVLGGGAVASWADAPAVGGLLDVAAGPDGRWAGVASLEATTSRTLSWGPGTVSWQRWQLGLGARFRLSRQPELALQAEAVGAALTLSALGFSTNGSALQFDPGARGSLRGAVQAGPLAVFLQLSATGWMLRELGVVQNLPGQLQVPRYEVLAVLGVALQRS